jgi:hypothetical protein
MKKLILIAFVLPLLIKAQVQLLPSIGIGSLPNDSDSVCAIIPRAQGNPWIAVNPGDTMADFTLYDISGNAVTLSSVLNTGKRVLMVAGSYTCPIFRNHMSDLNAVAAQFGNQIECFAVYEVEAHPTGSPQPSSGNLNPSNPPYNQPNTYGERKSNLQDLLNGVNGPPAGNYIPVPVSVPIYIDGPCNEWWQYYNGPNNAYLIDTNGVLFAYHNWFNNSNPPNGPSTNIWCDIDSLLGVNSGGCSQVTSLNGTFDFQLKSTSTVTSYGNPGDIIDIFGEFINTSNDGVQVNIERVMNNLPSNSWESSMCVTFCLPASQDTTSAIVGANDTIDFSFHFFTDPLMAGPDTGRARVRFTNANGSQQAIMQPYRGITYTTTSSIDETFTKVLVYPNPSDGTLYIESNFTEKSVVQITDLLGNTIKNIVVNKGENKIQIKNLPPAFYLVHINEKVCEKIVVR